MEEKKKGNMDQISMRQLMVLLFLSQLSPGIQLVCGLAARKAGGAGWLAVVLVVPLMWLLIWMAGKLSEGRGLAEGFQCAFGRWGSKGLVTLYIIWELLLLMVGLHLYGRRMTAASPGGTGQWFYLLVLAGVAAWMACGKLSAFARAGEIFYLAMVALLVVVLISGLLQIDVLNLIPLRVDELAGIPAAALEGAAVLSPVIYGAFLLPDTVLEQQPGKRAFLWSAALVLVLGVIQLIIPGGMGAAFVSRTETPLFVLARDMSIGGAIQRMEGLVISLWVLSDLMLVGLQALVASRLIRWVTGLQWRFLPILLVGAALVLGRLCFSDSQEVRRFSETVLPWGNLLLGFLVPALALFSKKIFRKKKKGDISCGPKEDKTKDIVV